MVEAAGQGTGGHLTSPAKRRRGSQYCLASGKVMCTSGWVPGCEVDVSAWLSFAISLFRMGTWGLRE